MVRSLTGKERDYQPIRCVAVMKNNEWRVNWNHDRFGSIKIAAWKPITPYKEETIMKCKDCKHDFNDGWIPVSERLPEEDIYCYVTVQAPGGQPHSHPGYYRKKYGFSWGYVTAWMKKTIPEPYKEEQQ